MSARGADRYHSGPESYALAAWLFLRALGLVSLCAFVSMHVQMIGLFGEEGIVPLAPRIDAMATQLGDRAWSERPTLLYAMGSTDSALLSLCWVGELASLSLLLGILSGPACVVCFALYLSIVNVGWPFYLLQWDTLLLESLALGAIMAPWSQPLSSPLRAREPAHVARWALWFLIGRLMFASGLVKLLGGDPVWSDLSALAYHYETQPLPNPIAQWMHAMPLWVHQGGVLFTYIAEVAAPLLLAVPSRLGRWTRGRELRRLVAAIFIVLQLLIALTGNYGFFNLLTIALCIPLIDDAVLVRALRIAPVPGGRLRWYQAAVPSALGAMMMVMGAFQLTTSLGIAPDPELEELVASVGGLRLTSSYGLFANMTTERDELILEGTIDGVEWRPYELHYKPGDVQRGLPWCTPHMPRLDWMMWFAALGDRRSAPWVAAFARGLQERRAPVMAMVQRDPFDGQRPRAIRVRRWRYRLAPPGGRETWIRSDETPW